MGMYQKNQGKIIKPRIKLNHDIYIIQLERVTVTEIIEIKAYKCKMVKEYVTLDNRRPYQV